MQFLLYLCLVGLVSRPTSCEKEEDNVSKDKPELFSTDMQSSTLHYYYESKAKLFGPADETFRLSAYVDVEYLGTGKSGASTFMMFIHNVYVLMTKANSTSGEPVSADDLYNEPTMFVQLKNGTISHVSFTKKDTEDVDVMNFKRSIISALQTNLVRDRENVVEMDILGKHKSHYRTSKLQLGTIEIKKHVSSKDIYDDHGQELDRDEVDIESDEVQHINGGVMTDVTGHLKVLPKPDHQVDSSSRTDNDGSNVDLGAYLNSDVKFKLTLRKHVKRSVSGHERLETAQKAHFQKRSLIGEFDPDADDRKRWLILRKDFDGEDKLSEILTKFTQNPTEASTLAGLTEILSLENKLGLVHGNISKEDAKKPALATQLIKLTKDMVSKCSSNWEVCREILDLYITAGGKDAENVLSGLVLSHPLSTEQRQELVQKLTFITKPTKHILNSVKKLWETLPAQDASFHGPIILSLGSLASRPTVSTGFQKELVELLRQHLKASHEADNTEQLSDVLEAIGNFGDNRLTEDVLDIAKQKDQPLWTLVGTLHALRRNMHVSSVQQWLVDLLTRPSSSCELRQAAVVTIKGELAYRNLVEAKNKVWPNADNSEVDNILYKAVLTEDEGFKCALEDIKEYFKLKGVLIHVNDTEERSRSKRGTEHVSCSTWGTYSGRYSELLSASQFSSDNSQFPNNRHCLTHLKYGPSKANVYIKAGVFAGENTATNRCKLYGKSIAKLKVFSKSVDLATAEAYRQKIGSSKTRVYLKVFGKTVLNINQAGPLSKTFPVYKPSPIRIEVFRIYIYVAKISVTINLAPRVDFTVKAGFCSGSSQPCSHCLTMTLKASARVSGGAEASLASLVRGGITIGVNLNYLLEGVGKLYPGVCFKFYHGHDKMSASIQAWYQIRSKVKVKVKLWPPKFKVEWKWGSKKTWKPEKLSWSFGSASRKLIASAGTCSASSSGCTSFACKFFKKLPFKSG
ncbi:uncharacterized protein LOC106151124 [Lingula anatina]|uniref:Uncharacterized protein LOC106151124 n=1 Tax=Lingula anatina TaxID=7574 RepID=A0A1S3H2H1_LINAN|nr:uncharacterized protein LOC106151124 [Lingula anatina]|eukprot:XP_013379676.1 uncharacterized protein LOC106151124 [Lingula anatina]